MVNNKKTPLGGKEKKEDINNPYNQGPIKIPSSFLLTLEGIVMIYTALTYDQWLIILKNQIHEPELFIMQGLTNSRGNLEWKVKKDMFSYRIV